MVTRKKNNKMLSRAGFFPRMLGALSPPRRLTVKVAAEPLPDGTLVATIKDIRFFKPAF